MAFLRPASSLAALLLVVAPSFARASEPPIHGYGIFWRVERDGTDPSYVFGTLHSSDPRVLALADKVEDPLDRAEVAIFEMLPGDDDRAAAVASFRLAGLLPEGQRLEQLVGPELFEKAASAARQHGFDRNDVQRLRPWAVAMLLLPPSTADADDGLPHVLDVALMSLAENEGKPLYGLEDIGDFVRLYGNMPLDVEIALLQDVLEERTGKDRDRAPDVDGFICLYLTENIAATFDYDLTAAERSFALEAAKDEFEIRRRNELWIGRLLPYLDAGGAFVAVGAGHLPGERGLLSLIERAGYTLTRLPLDAPSC